MAYRDTAAAQANRRIRVAHTDDDTFFVAFNSWDKPLDFDLPSTDKTWCVLVDTSAVPPNDIADEQTAPPLRHANLHVAPNAAVILIAR